MITETGRVVALEDNGVWVETIREGTCGSCSAKSACGHGLLNQLGSGRSHLVRVLPGDVDLSRLTLDQQVTIAIPESLMLRGSLLVYLLPLLAMLAGAAGLPATAYLPDAELSAVLGALLGLVAGAAIVRLHSWRHRRDPAYQPRLLAPRAADPLIVQS